MEVTEGSPAPHIARLNRTWYTLRTMNDDGTPFEIMRCCNCLTALSAEERLEVQCLQQMDEVWSRWIKTATGSTAEQVEAYIGWCMQVPVCLRCWQRYSWEDKQGFMHEPIQELIEKDLQERIT